ncbi:hypothetical protein CONPUDRAFT_56786 [Coniophora puteana RWD-64-598 SS2]|uniref:Protein ROT1 n=1 Tax=Coniophora puteana (strain RWD-64-598) TaxID=741705 RepID=A0A5M3MML2_CONPW|nr:uncharacterized protein CONPUDRAFT_56786 [Coniophora puteana RWD-64-598 SS2]EIW80419.1 hypothetical protein CONPUDRAFT_56786 [Coniophora puteana RWD-64-598 SS2]
MKGLLTLLSFIAAFSSVVLGQTDSEPIQYTPTHNITTIVGTWSSGSQAVVTGPGFASPNNLSFFLPENTGVSYSFTDDGFYEVAQFRLNGNGSAPNCATAVLLWAHGQYTLQPNGSITGVLFGDGYQQIQDPCTAVSSFVQAYNTTELYQSWGISQDPTLGYTLQLYQYNGEPLPPQYQITTSPIMLPTQPLRNVTPASTPAPADNIVIRKRSDASTRWGWNLGLW